MVDRPLRRLLEAVTANNIIVGLNEAVRRLDARADAEGEWRISDG
jgi:hypothetical protein